MNGLKPHIKYRLLLTGDLTNDGQHAFDTDVLVGSCVVETPDTVPLNADWVNFNDNPLTSNGSLAVNTQLRFSARNTEDPATGATPRFNRQMATLSSIKVTMTAGGKNVVDPKQLGEETLTQSDLSRDASGNLSTAAQEKLQKLGVDPAAAPATLGELMTSGNNTQGGVLR